MRQKEEIDWLIDQSELLRIIMEANSNDYNIPFINIKLISIKV